MANKVDIKKIVGASGMVAAGFAGLGYFTFRQLMYRKAFIPPLIGKIAETAMKKKNPITEKDKRVEWFENQSFEEYTIKNSNGEKLKGYFLKADEPSDVYVFCSHGYRNHAKGEFNYMTKYHHDRGRNVFLVDHRASGESEGAYIGFGYHEYKDCMKWLDFLIETFGKNIQIILHGVSMGCATVMMMTGSPNLPKNVKFTVADCGYTSAVDEFKFVLGSAHVPSFPLINTADFFNKKINGFSFGEVKPIEMVSHAKIPMLFIHGKADTFVPTFMANELYDACSSPEKDILLVDDAWHAESYLKATEAYESKVDAFADKFISNFENNKLYS